MMIYAISESGADVLTPLLHSCAEAVAAQDPSPSGQVLCAIRLRHESDIPTVAALPGVVIIPRFKPIGTPLATQLAHLGVPASATLEDVLTAAYARQPGAFFHPSIAA